VEQLGEALRRAGISTEPPNRRISNTPALPGNGQAGSWWGGSFRDCRRCDGKARRLRIGRRMFNWLRVLRNEEHV
jgi:hypothetical protein